MTAGGATDVEVHRTCDGRRAATAKVAASGPTTGKETDAGGALIPAARGEPLGPGGTGKRIGTEAATAGTAASAAVMTSARPRGWT